MSKYVLYGGVYTRAITCEMVLTEGNIDYELRHIDIVNGEHSTASFLKINSTGFVPAIITPDGQTLYETPAINLYLTDHHRLTKLAPGLDEADRGLFLSALFYITDELEPILKRYFYPHRYVFREQDILKMKEQAFGHALDRLSIIDQRLQEQGPYHLGDRYSLVDLTMAYWVTGTEPEEIFSRYPAIKDCVERVSSRQAIKHFFDDITKNRIAYKNLQNTNKGVR